MTSALRTLVGQMLRPFKKGAGVLDKVELEMDLFDVAASVGAEAVGGCGAGLDHLAGERVLAACFFRDAPQDWAEHRIACAITDRRTALSGWSNISGPGTVSDRRFSVLHRDIVRLEMKSSMLHNRVSLFSAQGRHDLHYSQMNAMLGGFYDAMLRFVPPDQRWEPPTPFVNAAA